MKVIYILLLILISILILCIISINIYNFRVLNYLKLESNIGNILSHYYYNVGHSFMNGKNFKIKFIKDKKTPKFLEKLPDKIEYDNLDFSEVKTRFIHAPWYDYTLNSGMLISMQPIIRKQLRSILKPIYTDDDVVIHFRCSDVPFNRHAWHTFIKYRWYLKAFKKLFKGEQLSGKKILLLSCSEHLSNKKYANLCKKYTEDLVDYLKKYVKNVTISCKSIEEDFVMMIYAKNLINMGSSMSYIAGLASLNKVIIPSYIEQTCSIRRGMNQITSDNMSILDAKQDRLYHHKVKNYSDVKTVVNQLREK